MPHASSMTLAVTATQAVRNRRSQSFTWLHPDGWPSRALVGSRPPHSANEQLALSDMRLDGADAMRCRTALLRSLSLRLPTEQARAAARLVASVQHWARDREDLLIAAEH